MRSIFACFRLFPKETDEFLEVFLNYCEVVRTAAQPAAVYYAPISSAASLRFDHCNMSCFLKAQTCRNLPIHFLFQSTNKRAELNKGKTHSYC